MKPLVPVVALALAAASPLAANAGVSVSVGQPGFYGRIDIGDLPPPPLIYAQPIEVVPAPVGVVEAPIYLRVPPGHAKHWSRHCREYDACDRPVYFVQDRWYQDVYVPRYRGHGRREHEDRDDDRPVGYVVAPPVAYGGPPPERLYAVHVDSVRAVMGPPERRCWVERQQVVEDRRGEVNVPGAIVGAVIGGVLGHQVGGGHGRDIATAGGAVAGAAIGANVGTGPTVYSQPVERCASVQPNAQPAYWDVSYRFRGAVHHAQLAGPPGRTLTVGEDGRPRG
ncbi:MAG: glycine zipper 2TM domain-containing protein [Candidatus Levyibacteriota bacterium]